MEPAEYKKLAAFESWYWWYIAQRENLIETILDLPLPGRPRVLDIGCGTGRNLFELGRRLPVRACGMDIVRPTATCWNTEGRTGRMSPPARFCLASANDIPFADNAFDLAFAVDVLDCDGVDTPGAFCEIRRVLAPGGFLVAFVPAYQWLRSRHDRAVHSARRFSALCIRSIATDAGLPVLRVTYRFASFLPAIAAVRLAQRAVPRRSMPPRSDLTPLPGWLNRVLLHTARWERRLFGRRFLPFGSTVMLVARKP